MKWAIFFLFCAASCAGPRASAPAPAERALGAHLEAALYRGAAPARSGDLLIRRVPGGSIAVTRVGPPAAIRDDDTVLASEIRSRLSVDPLILPRIVAVDVDRGVVRLSGALDGRVQAARAVLTALAVDGVRRVEATLSWIPSADLARLRSHAMSDAR
jgi:hypothetical protein